MKGHQGTSIIYATMLFGAVLVSPAFAQMTKVDEAELARANASVTGESVKNNTIAAEKAATVQESVTTGNLAKGNSVLVPYDNSLESVGISLNIKGQETFTFRVDRSRSEVTGGVTGVTPHR
ncbi:MAG: hypothetical protein CVU51_02720 [Deltaproteobacteria bacterium HGW-Deltaproteobacteria-1]|jgi:hypothetical protein|nr:MAG: hypothetical protein CVU51_02720 [Deltaproteobacteria bacterium HGW-Deltaproteobacteria-1]